MALEEAWPSVKHALGGPPLRWLFPIIVLLVGGCASGRIRDGAYVNEAKGFVARLPSTAWNVEASGEPDLLLSHRHRRAGISVHAVCGAIPPDRRVEIASRHLFFGIREKRILHDYRRADLRDDAVEVVMRGKADDEDLLLHGYTVKGSACLYDLVLFAAPEDYPSVNGDFEALVRGFRHSERNAP